MATTVAEEFRSRSSSFFANLVVAFFIWLVGIAVFVPLSSTVSSPVSLSLLVSGAFLILVLFFLGRSVFDGKIAIDRLDEMRKAAVVKTATGGNSGKIRQVYFKNYAYLVLILIIAILIVPLVWIINGALGGIALAAIVLAALLTGFPLIEAMLERVIPRSYQVTSL